MPKKSFIIIARLIAIYNTADDEIKVTLDLLNSRLFWSVYNISICYKATWM